MNLYKVTGRSYRETTFPEVIFITSVSETLSIIKFMEVQERENKIIESEFICERDNIIPTIDPIKEQA